MSDAKNIARAFRDLTEAHPDLPAIIAADITLPYGKLWIVSDVFARKMRAHGIGPDATVALDTTDMIASVGAMFAAARLGARFVSLGQAVIETSAIRPTHYLRSPEVEGRDGIDYILMDHTWSPKFAVLTDTDAGEIGFADAERPWWILHTSGTTGAPKFMELSQAYVYDRSMAACVDFRPLETRLCSLFACFTRPFHVRATAALLNACTIVDSVDPAFMHHHGVNLVCGAPLQAVEWAKENAGAPKFDVLQVSGAALADRDAELVLRQFEVVEDVYGASETNKSFVNVKAMDDGQLITTGKPADSTVEIVDPEGRPCEVDEEGRVRVRNGYMVTEYLGAPEASAEAFRDGWFYPGDRARWGVRRELVIVGRADDLINVGGTKISPASIDAVLMAVPGVRRAAAFQNPDPEAGGGVLAFVELDDTSQADRVVPRAHAACLEALGSLSTPEQILVTAQIPVTLDGTPRRRECQRIYLDFIATRG